MIEKRCPSDWLPFTPGFVSAEYNNIEQLSDYVNEYGKNVCAIMLEPIQGEAGIIIPSTEYMQNVRQLCNDNNILLIADEIQTGLGRTGKLLCMEHYDVKPDLLVLGKALSGGVYPVSCVLGNNQVMNLLEPGSHGSTYGGNPLASDVGMSALNVVLNDISMEHVNSMGNMFRCELENEFKNCDIVKDIRGKGLMNAIEINNLDNINASDICIEFSKNGLLTKPTHSNIIRFTPPLVINKSQMLKAIDIIKNVLMRF